jgi:hypothetical protein
VVVRRATRSSHAWWSRCVLLHVECGRRQAYSLRLRGGRALRLPSRLQPLACFRVPPQRFLRLTSTGGAASTQAAVLRVPPPGRMERRALDPLVSDTTALALQGVREPLFFCYSARSQAQPSHPKLVHQTEIEVLDSRIHTPVTLRGREIHLQAGGRRASFPRRFVFVLPRACCARRPRAVRRHQGRVPRRHADQTVPAGLEARRAAAAHSRLPPAGAAAGGISCIPSCYVCLIYI